MAKNKIVLICLFCVSIIIPNDSLVGNDGYCVRVTAASFVGVKEKGGNNKGFNDPALQVLMRQEGWLPGYAWCSFFVMAMLNECGVTNNITGWSPTAYNKHDVIFTDGKFKQQYTDNDVLVMTLSYSNFRKQRFKGIGHTGVVDRVGRYSVRTIEGNTNEQGMRDSRSQDGVYYKIRPLTKNLHITRWGKGQSI
jgi:hypothetical protein